jgi:hypothetical protein
MDKLNSNSDSLNININKEELVKPYSPHKGKIIKIHGFKTIKIV